MKCRKCGTNNPINVNKCIYCGTSLTKSSNSKVKQRNINNKQRNNQRKSSSSSKKQRTQTDNIIIGVIAALVAVLLIMGGIYAFNSMPKKGGFSGGGGGGGIASSATYKVTFNLNYETTESNPEEQIVNNGDKAIMPTISERSGYAFGGWFEDSTYTKQFDFSSPVKKNYNLFACWIDINDKTDTDGDGLTDPFEQYYKTDKTKADTDGDGLSDYLEVSILNLNPTKKDTDGDKILDGDEDFDEDGLSNVEEVKAGTNPANEDSDEDGLLDGKEANTHKTDPAKKDTDGDGASDGKEIEVGTDPLSAQSSFDMTFKTKDNNDSVSPSVDVKLTGKQVDSLKIEKVENNSLFPNTIPGYMGGAYDFSVDGSFGTATINFEFDSSKGGDPVIYYYNEKDGKLEPLATTINGNVASAKVNHFSKYILINRKVFESSFAWEDAWDSNTNYRGVEIVLVIDDSGSMTSNDKSNQRLAVAKTLIDNLPDNSKIGVVRFETSTEILTQSLTDNKANANSYLTTSYFKSSGNTYMYSAIEKSMSLFGSGDSTILKMIVVLSDGATSDTSRHSSVISAANSKGIRIYTVGLGSSSSSYFTSYLKPLANNTGAAFYLASNASELTNIYKDISKKIDIETDSDNDGVPDYYEENMVLFNGVSISLDKNNPDTDGDGLKDGKEVTLTYEYKENKTKVIVRGKINSDPTKVDTDNDGIKDDIDTAPFEKGLANGIVGALTICSYGDDVNSSGGISGHAYLAYTSYVNDTKTMYGILVGSYREVAKKNDTRTDKPASHTMNLKCNTVTTLGGWAGWLPDALKGSWINNEYHLFVDNGVPTDQRSLTKYVTDDQIDIIAKASKTCSKWDVLYNCSAYATEIWNKTFNDNLSAKALWCSPSTLSYNIEKRQGYKIAAPMLVPMP